MPDLILHIGHFKTGTTALQVFLSRNRDVLAHQGLVYCDLLARNGKHSALAYAILRDAGVRTLLHGFDHPDDAPTLWAGVFSAARALPDGQALLVSSEEFMRIGGFPAAIKRLRTVFAAAPDVRVRVIAYLRRPQSHLQSWHNQLVKLGLTDRGFDAAVREVIEPVHYDYALALAPWIDLFGAEAVILRGFTDDLRHGDELYADFLGALGHRLPLTAEVPRSDPNPRIDPRLLDLHRALNASGLPRRVVLRVASQMAKALADADAAQAVSDAAPGFDAIRARTLAGLHALAELPGAGFDAGALAADLPRPGDPGDPALAALATILGAEIGRTQTTLLKVLRRLDRLEAAAAGERPSGDDA